MRAKSSKQRCPALCIDKFFRLNLTLRFFGRDLGFNLVIGFGLGSGLYFQVRAGFGPELVGPFTTLRKTPKGTPQYHFLNSLAKVLFHFLVSVNIYLENKNQSF